MWPFSWYAKRRAQRLRRMCLRLGRRGERLACRLLEHRGMEILARNVRGPHGEIDIVARDGLILVFVEVKSRRHGSRARPADSVTRVKKEHVIRTAGRYLRLLGRPRLVHRYDVVEMIFAGRRLVEARHWPGEFSSRDIRPPPLDADW